MYNTIQYIYIFIQIERAGLKYLKYVHHTAALCYCCVFPLFYSFFRQFLAFHKSPNLHFSTHYTENNLMKRKKEQNIKITTYSLQYKKKWDTLSSIHTFTFFCSFSSFSSFLFFFLLIWFILYEYKCIMNKVWYTRRI